MFYVDLEIKRFKVVRTNMKSGKGDISCDASLHEDGNDQCWCSLSDATGWLLKVFVLIEASLAPTQKYHKTASPSFDLLVQVVLKQILPIARNRLLMLLCLQSFSQLFNWNPLDTVFPPKIKINHIDQSLWQ